MRISDWSSDVCSSDLFAVSQVDETIAATAIIGPPLANCSSPIAWRRASAATSISPTPDRRPCGSLPDEQIDGNHCLPFPPRGDAAPLYLPRRSEEHTSELQSLMRISYAVFCLKKKNKTQNNQEHITI